MAYFIHWRRTKKKKKERKRVVAASPCRSNESWHEHPLPRSFPLSPSSPTLSAFILEVLLPFPQKHPSRLIGRHAGSHKMTRTPLFLLLGFAFQIGEFSTKDSDSWALFFLFFTAPLFCYFPCVCFCCCCCCCKARYFCVSSRESSTSSGEGWPKRCGKSMYYVALTWMYRIRHGVVFSTVFCVQSPMNGWE